MRIETLLEELFQTGREQKSYSGELRKSRGRELPNEMGRGSQAVVKPDRTDPHMVSKHSINPYVQDRTSRHASWEARADDGFHRFISYLIKQRLMGENPHLPRVYNIKTITDNQGKHIHTYTVEKLIKTSEISKEELEAFIEHAFHPDTVYISEYVTDQDWVNTVFMSVAKVLDKCVTMDSYKKQSVKSESLSAAIDIVQKAGYAMSEPNDLHTDNFMWRRGSTGLTLVFNDPFY